MDLEFLDILSTNADNCRLSTLSDDGNSLPLGILFWERSQSLGDLLDISRSQTMAFSISQSLGLVTDNVIPVWSRSIKRIFEELRDERSGEREDKDLVVGRSLFSKSHDRRGADSQMITSNKVVSSTLDQLPDLRTLQVIQIIVVCGTEISTQRAVVIRDYDTTSASWLLLVYSVLDTEASLLDGIVKNSSIFIIANTTKKDDGVGWKEVLGTSGGVLSPTSGD